MATAAKLAPPRNASLDPQLKSWDRQRDRAGDGARVFGAIGTEWQQVGHFCGKVL
jgi:hypothetical protein